jgi:hypothetical protein
MPRFVISLVPDGATLRFFHLGGITQYYQSQKHQQGMRIVRNSNIIMSDYGLHDWSPK